MVCLYRLHILHAFSCLLIFLFKINFFKISSYNTVRLSNSLDPDQARLYGWPDLGPNCLQRSSASSKIFSDDSPMLFSLPK